MKWWTKLLPFIFVEWFAKRYLHKQKLGDHVVVSPYGGVWIFAGHNWPLRCKFLTRRPSKESEGN